MRPERVLLALAAVAVGFAAADTYVVVLALPDMMTSVGLDVTDLQQGAPVVSGFLLGYVGVLPVIGRVSDLRGPVPVVVGSLLVLALGSVVTAAAYDLPSMVTGRLLQGVGGGGLVPPTLSMVAAAWPPERRGVPLGLVGAVQELGSVLGPLLGAAILALGDWRDIFWLNTAVGLLLAAAVLAARRPDTDRAPAVGRADVLGLVLALLAVVGLALTMLRPDSLTTRITIGLAFLPVAGDSRWLAPVALATYGLVALLVLRTATARRPLVAWRSWPSLGRAIDLPGALLLTAALGAVVVTFASADPERAEVPADAAWMLPIAVVAFVGLVLRQRRATTPLVPRGTFADRRAWGALVVSFFVGAALIAALVDIPFFARLTVYRDSQLDAALVLVRFLVALPVGALLGGWLLRRFPASVLSAVGMLMSALAFVHMATWDERAVVHPVETLSLVLAGLGFGLAIAPVNAVLLARTASEVHGLVSAFLVVSRMVGMLVGISVLTAVGLTAFQRATDRIPTDLCRDGAACPAYQDAVEAAALTQLHAVFAGAAVCAALAAVLSLVLLRDRASLRSQA